MGRAMLGTAERNNLPDSAFAYIEPGGTKDSTGKTTPRSKRHFPVHDAEHVRNALARIGQGAKFGELALPKVKAAARKFGIQVAGRSAIAIAENDSDDLRLEILGARAPRLPRESVAEFVQRIEGRIARGGEFPVPVDMRKSILDAYKAAL
jgi:hypothetical protein